jgi:hypothetical protein
VRKTHILVLVVVAIAVVMAIGAVSAYGADDDDRCRRQLLEQRHDHRDGDR